MTPTSRQEALARGVVRYFTGKACARGHIAERYAKSCVCVRCNAEGMARWAKGNPDRARHWSAHTYAKKRDVIIARSKVWSDANPERRRAISRKWATAHKDEVAFHRMAARAKRAGCLDDLTLEDIKFITADQTSCKYCGSSSNLSFDHLVSLARGGAHTKSNIQILCLPCNMAKQTTDEAEFLARRKTA